ncbi:MAG: type II toxin-antitoxin system HicA family toxin [Aggregatilineales bacterium]
MAKLPSISGQECVDALAKVDFYFVRRSHGTHLYVRRNDPFAQIAIPDHRDLPPGTLRRIIRDAGLSVDEFVKLL